MSKNNKNQVNTNATDSSESDSISKIYKKYYMDESASKFFKSIEEQHLKCKNVAKLLGIDRSLIYKNYNQRSQIELWEFAVLYSHNIADLTPTLVPQCKNGYLSCGKQLKPEIENITSLFDDKHSLTEKETARKELSSIINHLLAQSLADAINNKRLQVSSCTDLDSSLIYNLKNERDKYIQPWLIIYLNLKCNVNLLDSLFT